jgi:hypothetical protein
MAYSDDDKKDKDELSEDAVEGALEEKDEDEEEEEVILPEEEKDWS